MKNHSNKFLTPAQAAVLLATALAYAPALVPALVCQLFAGMRLNEACQLTWEHVLLDIGAISVAMSKSGNRRIVTISPNLREWLAGYHREMGPLFAGSQTEFVASLRKVFARAGIERVPCQLRRSFLVYHLTRFYQRHKTASEAGTIALHLGNCLVNSTSPQAAEAYWNILPTSAALDSKNRE